MALTPEDPTETVYNLIDTYWDADKAGRIKPVINLYSRDAKLDQKGQVVVRDGTGNAPIRNLGQNSYRRVRERIPVEIFAVSSEDMNKILYEVDRIIEERSLSPGGDLDHILSTSWRALNERMREPDLFHKRLIVIAVYDRVVTRA